MDLSRVFESAFADRKIKRRISETFWESETLSSCDMNYSKCLKVIGGCHKYRGHRLTGECRQLPESVSFPIPLILMVYYSDFTAELGFSVNHWNQKPYISKEEFCRHWLHHLLRLREGRQGLVKPKQIKAAHKSNLLGCDGREAGKGGERQRRWQSRLCILSLG